MSASRLRPLGSVPIASPYLRFDRLPIAAANAWRYSAVQGGLSVDLRSFRNCSTSCAPLQGPGGSGYLLAATMKGYLPVSLTGGRADRRVIEHAICATHCVIGRGPLQPLRASLQAVVVEW